MSRRPWFLPASVSWDDAGVVEDQITGTLAAAVTPLRDGGERLDEDALAALFEFYGASGLDGLLVLGTTGEGILLVDAERRRVAELVIAGVETLRVIVNCGAQTTAQTCALAAHASKAGADAVVVIGPPYFGLNERELLEHFTAAAAACAPLPFYLYEYADRTGYAVTRVVVEKLRERVANLVGMKISDMPFERVEPYLALGLDVFVGAEALILKGLDHGAVGAVSGVAAAFPEAVSALVHEPTAERAALVDSLRSALSKHTFQASVKAALGLRGLPVRPDVRAPLRPLTPEATDQLRSILASLLGEDSTAPPVRS
jgi:dihydrodipicolinate synthase/N-acetylneuraminate lyase